MLKEGKSFMTKISSLFVLWLVFGSASVWAGENFDINSLFPLKNSYSELDHFLRDGALKVGASKTVTVYANRANNHTGIYISLGMRFKFTVGSPEWNNGSKETTAAGYDSPSPRRHPGAKLMELVADITATNGGSYIGEYAHIGMGDSSWRAEGTGYLNAFANDCLPCYDDNSRVVTLTIKRLE
jgi:hypothetical protein